MSSKSKVYFFFNKTVPSFRDRTRLKRHIESVFSLEKRKLSRLNYVFCSDRELLKINRQYLGHDYYTDIITFDLSETDREITGEVYISIDRVRENALNLGEEIQVELTRVIFHGALHLCGLNDKSKAQKAAMRAKEDYYLRRYIS